MVLGSTKPPDSFMHIWIKARHFVAKCFRVGPFFFSTHMYRIDPSIFDFLQKQNMQKTFDVYIKTEGLRLLEYFFFPTHLLTPRRST